MAKDLSTNEYYGYIYLMVNKINGFRYVGQTVCGNAKKRLATHLKAAKNNPQIVVDKAIAKYGKENFSFEVIDKVVANTDIEMRAHLDLYEIHYIEKYESHISFGHGYNVSKGGSLTPYNLKYYDAYDMNGNLVYANCDTYELSVLTGCSENMIYAISSGKVGNHHNTYVFRHHGDPFDMYDTKISIKVLYQFTPDRELVKVYNGGRPEAEKVLGYKIHSINHHYKLCHGYSFSNTGECEFVGHRRWNKNNYLEVYTTDGVQVFNNIHIYDCAHKLGIISTDILRVCDGEYTSTHNYIFRYSGDDLNKYSLIKNANRDYSTRTIYCFNKNTGHVEYKAKSISDASRYIGLTFVIDAINNPNVCVGHYWLSYNNEFKYVGNPYKVSVDVYDKNKNYVCTYSSVSECARAYGINTTTVSNICKGRYNITRHGLVFRYSGDPIDLGKNDSTTPSKRIKLYNIPVACYDKDNNLIKEYDSLSTAAKDMPNGRPNVIRSVCDGFRSTAYNYYWRYVEQSA